MPEEHKENNNDKLDGQNGALKPKSSNWKFFAALLGILLIVITLFAVFQRRQFEQKQKKIADIADKAKQEEGIIYKQQLADTYGGKTPQETLKMYIAAIEKGDYNLAGKYFVAEKQQTGADLLAKATADERKGYLLLLNNLSAMKGAYSADGKIYSIAISDKLSVKFNLYSSGIWKIGN